MRLVQRWNCPKRAPGDTSRPFTAVAPRRAALYMFAHIYDLAYTSDMPISLPDLFSCMADATRLRILTLLGKEGDLCVCEIVHALSDIQPKISRHLAVLRKEGVVVDDRDGTRVFYGLSPQLPDWIRQMILRVSEETATEPPYRDDLARLRSMPNRPVRSQVA